MKKDFTRRSILVAFATIIAMMSSLGAAESQAADHEVKTTGTGGNTYPSISIHLYKSVFNPQTMMYEWQLQGAPWQTMTMYGTQPFGQQTIYKYKKGYTGLTAGSQYCGVMERWDSNAGTYVLHGEDNFTTP